MEQKNENARIFHEDLVVVIKMGERYSDKNLFIVEYDVTVGMFEQPVLYNSHLRFNN